MPDLTKKPAILSSIDSTLNSDPTGLIRYSAPRRSAYQTALLQKTQNPPYPVDSTTQLVAGNASTLDAISDYAMPDIRSGNQ